MLGAFVADSNAGKRKCGQCLSRVTVAVRWSIRGDLVLLDWPSIRLSDDRFLLTQPSSIPPQDRWPPMTAKRNDLSAMTHPKEHSLTWLLSSASSRYGYTPLSIFVDRRSSAVSVCAEREECSELLFWLVVPDWLSTLQQDNDLLHCQYHCTKHPVLSVPVNSENRRYWPKTTKVLSHMIGLQGIGKRLDSCVANLIHLKFQCLQCLSTKPTRVQWKTQEGLVSLDWFSMLERDAGNLCCESHWNSSVVWWVPTDGVFIDEIPWFNQGQSYTINLQCVRQKPSACLVDLVLFEIQYFECLPNISIVITERKERISGVTWLIFNRSLRCWTPSIPMLLFDSPSAVSVYDG